MGDNAEYGLIVSFEDQSASYVHGFEVGQIHQRMNSGTEAEFDVMIHAANKETLTRMTIAYGWSVTFTPTEYPEWIEAAFEKTRKAPDRPNPVGLRVVTP